MLVLVIELVLMLVILLILKMVVDNCMLTINTYFAYVILIRLTLEFRGIIQRGKGYSFHIRATTGLNNLKMECFLIYILIDWVRGSSSVPTAKTRTDRAEQGIFIIWLTLQIWKELQANSIEHVRSFTSTCIQIIHCDSPQFPSIWKSWMEQISSSRRLKQESIFKSPSNERQSEIASP